MKTATTTYLYGCLHDIRGREVWQRKRVVHVDGYCPPCAKRAKQQAEDRQREEERLARFSKAPRPEGLCWKCGGESADLYNAAHSRYWCRECFGAAA